MVESTLEVILKNIRKFVEERIVDSFKYEFKFENGEWNVTLILPENHGIEIYESLLVKSNE